ncbi:ABC transporter permease [Flammeovirgaceae bacterium SG7u.111]|nr:ABC transporter permease [Flammeovirgaceae bacterium SG7u.132]WPO34526.1 ABC transporter permease [Flammeovirgaceae bacterium SG7u.111]
MFNHSLLLAFRNFKKHKVSFFINLIGLTTGIACTLFIYLWVNDELKKDQFHQKSDRLYRAMEHQQYAEEIMTTSSTPGILAETIAEEIPEVEYAATTTWVSPYTLSIKDHNVKAEGYHVGKDYFNIFSYPLIHGDPDKVLADKMSMVISEELANNLFGTTEDVIGKMVEFQHEKSFMVSGVFENVPTTSSEQFDFVLNFEEYKDDNDWVLSWGNNGPKTYLILHEDTDVAALNEKVAEYIKGKNEESNVTLFFAPYTDRYLYSRYENGVQAGGRIEYIQIFSVIAGFILLIACINFMNLSTARASRRIKEVGVKKALGAKRGSLITQFLAESMLIAILSLLVALIIVFILLPQFNGITDKQIEFAFDSQLLLALLSITLITGLVSGSYPALYLSGFRPIKVLKGEVKSSLGELWARRGLVIFQFTLSIILIVSVVVIFKQIEFVQNKNLGYDKENIIYFEINGAVEKNLETFLTEMRKVPGVVAASSIGHNLVGRQNNTSGLNWDGKDPDDLILFENVRLNYGMIETLKLEMVEGRSFMDGNISDTSKIIFNETAIKIMGLEDPIGKTIRLWDEYDMEIVGVVKDFHFQSFHENVNPLFFRLDPDMTWNVMARIAKGEEKNTIAELTDFYQSYNAGFTFDYHFLDKSFEEQYNAELRVAVLSRYFAALAILISCLGLYGLAAFTAERRLKEIGIRKVLGSSVSNIVLLLSKDFTRMVLASIVLAIPISFFIVNTWLERFAYRIDMEIWYFASAGLLALFIAWITVGLQAYKAASVNPTKCLRSE